MDRVRIQPDPESLEAFLREGGWKFVRLTPDTWRIRFRRSTRTFPILVRLDPDGWLVLAIVPYFASPEDAEVAQALYERLLQLNQVLFLAKFSIDDDLDVVLSVEYPTSELDRSELRDALDALGYYADLHFEELVAIASADSASG
ncbi:MAG: YbjN domain-containing protein [Myxococcota bacterium]|jgi:hypothetical protein|nr:YbjN domain-containing protein [Myxococcota bacterium]